MRVTQHTQAPQDTGLTMRRPSTAVAVATLVALMVAGCGGGGGGGSADTTATTAVTEQPQAVVDTGASTGPAINRERGFYFAPSAALAQAGALNTLAGGRTMSSAWNPNNPATVLSAGLHIAFFGEAAGCQARTQGPVDSFNDARLANVASLTGLPAAHAGAALRWTPSGDTSRCATETQGQRGASAVYLAADDAAGAVGMLTGSRVQADGSTSFFGPYSAGGQDGAGNNANITGTFVAFRQPLSPVTPVQPWAGGTLARVSSRQSVGTATVEGSGAEVVQVQQQMMVTFVNRQCLSQQAGPCQVQYLINTNMVRSGVTDWSTVTAARQGRVWFDPVQGSLPIVSGPALASGRTTTDASGLALWSSQGSASQHGTFSGRTFDVTISFAQLQNVLRSTTASHTGTPVAQVTDAQVADLWGSAWNDSGAWQLLTAHVGQEVYNPDAAFAARIGGGFSHLYVGAQ